MSGLSLLPYRAQGSLDWLPGIHSHHACMLDVFWGKVSFIHMVSQRYTCIPPLFSCHLPPPPTPPCRAQGSLKSLQVLLESSRVDVARQTRTKQTTLVLATTQVFTDKVENAQTASLLMYTCMYVPMPMW